MHTTSPKNTRARRPRRKRKPQRRLPRSAGILGIAGALMVILLLLLLPKEPEAEPVSTEPTLEKNKYVPEDFVYDGDYLTCTAGRTRLGIDVSAHQQDIDWQQVKDAGMEFAMVRIGYRGYSQGGIHADDYAAANIQGAQAAGLEVGVYFYSQAVSIEEAAEEAMYCIRFLEEYDIDMPVVYDWEYVSAEARTGNMDRQTLTRCIQVFCDTMKKSGYEAMVYFNPSIGRDLMDLPQLQDYLFWLAMYTDQMDYPYAVEMWQYTETGSVPGIDGNVDINIQFLDET